MLREHFRRQRLHADRHPLDALGALLRGDDDVTLGTIVGRRCALVDSRLRDGLGIGTTTADKHRCPKQADRERFTPFRIHYYPP